MIRYGIAYCPSCMRRLDYNRQEDYFWCECDGWQHLAFRDREKEIEAAERFDIRRDFEPRLEINLEKA